MEILDISIDWQNRRFIRDIFYGPEDGLPEGYSLYLEETVHPADDVFYRNGAWGCIYDLSPQTLTLIYNHQEEKYSYQETIELDEIETGCLYWLDIYDDIILYSSPDGPYKSTVLYNIKTKKKITITNGDGPHDIMLRPRLLVRDQEVYVGFENKHEETVILCFDKNTFEQINLRQKLDVRGYIMLRCTIKSDIEERGEETNLLPDPYYNRYGVGRLSTIIHEVKCRQRKYKECPMSLIKQMYKIRLAYAKENNIKITQK